MNAEAVVKGIEDALSGAEPGMPADEMRKTLAGLKQKIVADQRAKKQQTELQYLSEGKTFMEENAKKEGVVTTESGLQYKMISEGAGQEPGPTDKVTVNYRGTLIDGKEFDSSYKRGKPATFGLNAVIKGWSEGLQLMKEGGKAQFFIPPESGLRRSRSVGAQDADLRGRADFRRRGGEAPGSGGNRGERGVGRPTALSLGDAPYRSAAVPADTANARNLCEAIRCRRWRKA